MAGLADMYIKQYMQGMGGQQGIPQGHEWYNQPGIAQGLIQGGMGIMNANQTPGASIPAAGFQGFNQGFQQGKQQHQQKQFDAMRYARDKISLNRQELGLSEEKEKKELREATKKLLKQHANTLEGNEKQNFNRLIAIDLDAAKDVYLSHINYQEDTALGKLYEAREQHPVGSEQYKGFTDRIMREIAGKRTVTKHADGSYTIHGASDKDMKSLTSGATTSVQKSLKASVDTLAAGRSALENFDHAHHTLLAKGKVLLGDVASYLVGDVSNFTLLPKSLRDEISAIREGTTELESMSANIRRDLFGQTLTGHELTAANKVLPNAGSPEARHKKLKILIRLQEKAVRRAQWLMEKYGQNYDFSKVSDSDIAAAAAATGTTDDMNDTTTTIKRPDKWGSFWPGAQ